VEAKEVKNVLKQMLIEEGAEVNFDDCKSEVEKLNKCLGILDKRLKIKSDAKSLVEKLEDLKMTERETKVEVTGELDEDSVIILAE
jgi:hypothetical protein